MPQSVTGALDGLILMTVFTVAEPVGARESVLDGAIVVFIVATPRTLIIPLEYFGMVGGRLGFQSRALGEPNRRQLLSASADRPACPIAQM